MKLKEKIFNIAPPFAMQMAALLMKEIIKYGTCCVVTAVVMLTALYALNRGYKKINGDTTDHSYSIFKPFSSLFGKENEKEEENIVSQKPEQEPPKKNDSEKESKKEKNIVPKEFTITESEEMRLNMGVQKKTESKNSETSSTLILIREDERSFSKESKRQITMPLFDAVFVPTYPVENFTDRTIEQFQKTFPALNPRDNTFVIEREIASSFVSGALGEGKSYEVSVYDKEGTKFLGTFETDQNPSFPFRGLPQFLKAGDGQFDSSFRFFIFSDISESTREVLSSEEHFLTVFQNVYQSLPDSGLFIGKDPKSGYEIYTLFPGIFIAQRLR
jgi:hypothetical protein